MSLSQRQQRMLVYMLSKGIKKNEQKLYLSPFFYTQMMELTIKGLVEKNIDIDNCIIYTLTKKGVVLSNILKSIGVVGSEV